MNKFIFILASLFSIFLSKAQSQNAEQLDQEISENNDRHLYEKSIITLEKIINNKETTSQKRYEAYIQKAYTFKRLYNYPEVLENLNLALQESIGKDFSERAEVRILTEKMFVEFDLRNFNEARTLIKEIDTKNTQLLDSNSFAFLLSSIAVLQIIDKDYKSAKVTLDKATLLLEKENPKHLPIIYSKKIGLAEHIKDLQLAEDSFKKGIKYAKDYNQDAYQIALYRTMSNFFATMGDYKEAYNYESQGVEISSLYNANFQSGKLGVLEKNLITKRNTLELEYQKKWKYVLIFSIITLCVLLLLIIKLYQSNKQKNKLIERENHRMRMELKELSQNIDKKTQPQEYIEQYNLSSRQLQIIDLVKKGHTNREIGKKLFISENTVKYHLKIIYNNMGIEKRWHLFEEETTN